MAEVLIIEEERIIGLTIEEAEIATGELALFKQNMDDAASIFGVSVRNLINKLQARQVTTEDVIATLLDDFENDGRIFGGLKRGLVSASDEMIQNTENQVARQQWDELGFDENETWVSVFVNTCEDCLPRHGITLPHSRWEAMGLPGTGWSVCKEHCQCNLIPAQVSVSKKELQAPIKRVRGRIRQIAKEKKKAGQIKNVNKYVTRKLGKINNTAEPLRPQFRKLLPGFKK